MDGAVMDRQVRAVALLLEDPRNTRELMSKLPYDRYFVF